MNVLSLFDGISCGRVALERAGYDVKKYYAAEIDKHAIKVSQKNWPSIIQLGDVQNWRTWDIDWSSIDLILAGFPCQAWSSLGRKQGDKDERGKLFWTMLDIMKNCPNASFLIENVRMKNEFEEYITHHTAQALGNVHKILINSALVSAQSRNRYYWTSWQCEQPKDLDLTVGDILTDARDPISPGWNRWFNANKKNQTKKGYCKILTPGDKAICMTARQYASWSGNFIELSPNTYRKLTPVECERLQTLPDDYTAGISNTQRYKALGNGWTVDVICGILETLKNGR
jgi:DNA (cytosine-5)-methyltransferase 1/DNA (cytosine-5)-methyltransferase 3A